MGESVGRIVEPAGLDGLDFNGYFPFSKGNYQIYLASSHPDVSRHDPGSAADEKTGGQRLTKVR